LGVQLIRFQYRAPKTTFAWSPNGGTSRHLLSSQILQVPRNLEWDAHHVLPAKGHRTRGLRNHVRALGLVLWPPHEASVSFHGKLAGEKAPQCGRGGKVPHLLPKQIQVGSIPMSRSIVNLVEPSTAMSSDVRLGDRAAGSAIGQVNPDGT